MKLQMTVCACCFALTKARIMGLFPSRGEVQGSVATIDATDYGVVANDGHDDSAAIQAIIDSIPIDNLPENRYIIQFPAGEINIHDEVHVDRSGIVIQGQGNNPNVGTKVVVNSWAPYSVDDGNNVTVVPHMKSWPGYAAFRVETRLKYASEQASDEGSINLHWKHKIGFTSPAFTGDSVLTIEAGKAGEFSVGSLVYVGAATDKSFLDAVGVPDIWRGKSHMTNGHMRTQIFKVEAVDVTGNKITIDKPLEFDVPLANENGYVSSVMPVTAVENVEFRNFYLTMDSAGTGCSQYNAGVYSDNNPQGVGFRYENLCPQDAIHGIVFKWAHMGVVDNVHIQMIGSHPIATEYAKGMKFSNNTIDGSWNKGKGGNGYFRGSRLYGSHIVGNTIQNVRHLTLQTSSTGNVVEQNTLNCDINLHGGFERNNIIRYNVVEVPFEHRAADSAWLPIWYGTATHASKWSGPTGPNNVLLDNIFSKAWTAEEPISLWGLLDVPGIEYHLAYDGNNFLHVNVGDQAINFWTNNSVEEALAESPRSGILQTRGS